MEFIYYQGVCFSESCKILKVRKAEYLSIFLMASTLVLNTVLEPNLVKNKLDNGKTKCPDYNAFLHNKKCSAI